jgi:hypothetical protein
MVSALYALPACENGDGAVVSLLLDNGADASSIKVEVVALADKESLQPDIQQLLQALYPSGIGPIAPSSRSHHDHNEDKEVVVEKEEETKGKEGTILDNTDHKLDKVPINAQVSEKEETPAVNELVKEVFELDMEYDM